MCKTFRSNEGFQFTAVDMAQKVAWQLREMAKTRGYDPRGIKVFSKGNSCDRVRADAQVSWQEGPEAWANSIVMCESIGVWVEPTSPTLLSFYNI